MDFQRELRGDVVMAKSDFLPFMYPPVVAAALCPLTKLSLYQAFRVTAVIALMSGILALLALRRFATPPGRSGGLLILLGSLGFVPFYLNTVFGGQLAWLGVVIFAATSILVLTGRYFLAGTVLALGYYKPPLFLVAALYFSIRLGRPFLAGAFAGALVLIAASVAVIGLDESVQYLETASRYTYGKELMPGFGLPSSLGAGIYGLTTTLFSAGPINLAINATLWLAVLALAVFKAGNAGGITPLELALVITASVGLSVQCGKYDVAILLVPFVLFASEWYRIDSSLKYAVAAVIASFYFEYWGRERAIAGLTVHLSSVLFLLLIGGLLILAARTRNQSESLYQSESL
jgi:hypothetical protein